jgi:uncharacterized membrane protein required for colicin V production
MFNWIDVVIVIIVLYNVVRGFSLGFIRSVVGIIGYILAFWVSKEYHQSVTLYFVENFKRVADFKSTLAFKIEELLMGSIAEGTASLGNVSLEGSDIPFLQQLNLKNFINIESAAVTTAHDIGLKIADFVVNGIGAILIFLLVLLAVKIIGIILNALMELPVLKGVNRFAGLLVGLIKGSVFVFVLMTLFAFLSPAIHDTSVMQALYQSQIGSVLYNNNILLALINMFLLG